MNIPRKIMAEYVEKYRRRELSRDEIKNTIPVSETGLNSAIHRAGIEFWDRKVNQMTEKFKELSKIYAERKMTRKEIADKYKVNFDSFHCYLRKKGIEVWDLKRAKEEIEETEFFNWRELAQKSDYAKLFYYYNR